MKRARALILAIFLIFLTACAPTGEGGSKRDEEMALSIRGRYIAAAGLSMTMNLTADYGERVYEYKLQFEGTATEGEISVLSPEIVKGLTILLKNGATSLKFDGAELSTGSLYGDGKSPLEAVSSFLSAWQTGYISQCYTEKLGDSQTLAVQTPLTDTALLTTWFDKESHLPKLAEISQDGFVAIRCTFEAASLHE